MPHRLLVIEEPPAFAGRSVYTALVEDAAFNCQHVGWEELVPQDLHLCGNDLIVAVASLRTPKIAHVFEWLNRNPIVTPTLAVLPVEADEDLLRMVSKTVDDIVFPPVRVAEVRHRMERVLEDPRRELEAVRRQLVDEIGLTKLVGKEPAFTRAIEQVPRFACTDMPVLITGETGTGKEVCARALHHLGRRRDFPFVAVDCAAIPEQLFENELFGHASGAFSGADRDHRGLVSLAEGGTLLLDEIDALSLGAQGKLLRFLQEHTFRALGSERTNCADVRVIAATNRDLNSCVANKQFRSDLFFRLNVLHIHLPPLRERRRDIELLAYGFLKEVSASLDTAPKSFSPAALRVLALYDWPGNIRELGNVVQRAAVACRSERIRPPHIVLLGDGFQPDGSSLGTFRAARAAAVAAFERRYVEELLRKHRGNVTHAAREAQQDRRAFGRFIKKYHIDRQDP